MFHPPASGRNRARPKSPGRNQFQPRLEAGRNGFLEAPGRDSQAEIDSGLGLRQAEMVSWRPQAEILRPKLIPA